MQGRNGRLINVTYFFKYYYRNNFLNIDILFNIHISLGV